MAAKVNTEGSTITLGAPQALFTTEAVGMQNTGSSQFNAKYGVTADGQRFLIVVRD